MPSEDLDPMHSRSPDELALPSRILHASDHCICGGQQARYSLEGEVGLRAIQIFVLRRRRIVIRQGQAARPAARVNGEWLILDNRTLTLVHDTDLTRSIPVFVLDHEGVRRFNWAGRGSEAADSRRAGENDVRKRPAMDFKGR
jgi:hypothetical protein